MAHRFVYHSILGLKVIKKKKKSWQHAGVHYRGTLIIRRRHPLDHNVGRSPYGVLGGGGRRLLISEVTMCSGSEKGSYLWLIDLCITQL